MTSMLYPPGEIPPLGHVPEKMYASLSSSGTVLVSCTSTTAA
ncbi:hypothetical protein ACFQ1S_12230 [Kibdelosporangium lantanae]|uniref:Uncharacterized protein n=1 Tax=Kibdelosporangium lantanae TaxID=1497396 RepID=A0ABW3M6D8_9PSEU